MKTTLSFEKLFEKTAETYIEKTSKDNLSFLQWQGLLQLAQDVYFLLQVEPTIYFCDHYTLEIFANQKKIWSGKLDKLGIASPELNYEQLYIKA